LSDVRREEMKEEMKEGYCFNYRFSSAGMLNLQMLIYAKGVKKGLERFNKEYGCMDG
jgi:SNF family Na+-dependent transporter